MFTGCKKSLEYDIKYEIIASSPVTTPHPSIITKLGLGTSETHIDFTQGTTWSKSTSIYSRYKPLNIILNPQFIYLTDAGTVTTSLYINGKKEATASFTSVPESGKHLISTTPISFTIN